MKPPATRVYQPLHTIEDFKTSLLGFAESVGAEICRANDEITRLETENERFRKLAEQVKMICSTVTELKAGKQQLTEWAKYLDDILTGKDEENHG